MTAQPEARPRRYRASPGTSTAGESSGRPRLLGWLALVSLLTVWFYEAPDGPSPSVIWPVLISFYILLARSLRRPVEIKAGIRSYATVEVLFMVIYYGLFFSPYQMVVLGQLNLYKSKFLTATFVGESNRAIILASLALVSFLAALALGGKKSCSRLPCPRLLTMGRSFFPDLLSATMLLSGPGSVVTGDISSVSVAAGVPARVITDVKSYRLSGLEGEVNIKAVTQSEKRDSMTARERVWPSK
jgi:hypothetical protein